jgi:hypothetical protein
MDTPGFDIYLVPAGPQGYELYCEVEGRMAALRDGRVDGDPDANVRGWRGWMARTFQQAVTYIDNERQRRHERAHLLPHRTWAQRMRDRLMAWVAERVAEQRLLWHLRTEHDATVHHPDDLSGQDAAGIVLRSLKRDARRHLVWMVIDGCGFLAALPFTALPGPNVPAYYFSFRMIGHGLSAMGARHGLRRVTWRYEPSGAMTDLRACVGADASQRDAIAHEVAARLNLRQLATFVERLTVVKPML